MPSEHSDHMVFIEFEGARQAAEVWLNGHRLGLYENGVMAFGFELTGLLNFGKNKPNVIAVRVDNSWDYKERATGSKFQWNDRNFNANYGGLNKHVFLHVTNKLFQTLPLYSNLKTTGVYIYGSHYIIPEKSAVITVESEVCNRYTKPKTVRLDVIMRDIDQLIVKEFNSEESVLQPGETRVLKASALVRNLNFWSWGYGYLYEFTTTLSCGKRVEDRIKTKTVFRKTEFGNVMIKLNDRVIQIKGYAQRTTNEWPGVGSSVPAWLSDYSNHLMVESNGNLVRWMHVTRDQDVESCDGRG
jgi:beta-galactosidase/beta-glucuronidase